MTFGEKLQKLRKEKGWSQEQLATQISVSRQALSKWELGTAIPDTENALRISKLFGVSIDYLLKDAYESDNDFPAAQITHGRSTRKYKGNIRMIVGSTISCLATVGLLIIGLVSAIYPAYNTFPMEIAEGETNRAVVKTGLPAFLELHNIGWLFALCIILVIIGITIVIYPKIHARILRK